MSIYDFKVLTRKGEEKSMYDYKDKVLLIFNSATRCGFTPQYTELEALYEKYHDRGLEVLDFPCNQFGSQAPGTDDEIHDFCTVKYNTKFDQFKKIDVNGPNASPLFTFLKEKKGFDKENFPFYMKMVAWFKDSNYKNSSDIKWNFTKFLVDRNGEVIGRYESNVKPEQIAAEIEKLL